MAWPADTPDLQRAERALREAWDGASEPIADVASQVARSLSDLERAALAGAPLPFDAAPVRRALAMRVRVGVAFATAPPPGSSVDGSAVATLLREIDDLLSDVNALAEGAATEQATALGACRSALVREAIDFSEAAQRYTPAALVVEEEPLPAARLRPARAGPPGAYGGAGVLALARTPQAMVIALVACAALAVAWGWSLLVGH
jgi:hypothetical protein